MSHTAGPGHSLGGSHSGASLTPDELRRRRLAALGGGGGEPPPPSSSSNIGPREPPKVVEPESNMDEDEDLAAALAMSLSPSHHHENPATASGEDGPKNDWYKSIDAVDVSSFHSIMWDSVMTTENDKSRWVGQGIDFRQEDNAMTNNDTNISSHDTVLEAIGSDHGPWGLTQTHGGPCGVLAAVQAELLRILLFGGRNPLTYPTHLDDPRSKADLSRDMVRKGLAMSIAIIMARAALTPSASDVSEERKKCVSVVLSQSAEPLTWVDLEPWSAESSTAATAKPSTLQAHIITLTTESPSKRQKHDLSQQDSLSDSVNRLAYAVTNFLLESSDGKPAPLEAFRRPGGVLLLVMSLVCSRGRKVIQNEMDDPPSTKLTSQFGHCGQELINLLLTGQAVSNVFDNTLTPSGELTCRGVQSRPLVGYLTQLEALRYCEVGGYYKSPQFPIWVVGSTSHFTVLFGDASCLKESKSDMLLEKCRRAFKAVEGGEENGFIVTQNFGTALKALDLDIGGDHAIQTLAASLEVSGAGIILWDDFWKTTSRLLTGASLNSVLEGDGKGGAAVGDSEPAPPPPPLLLTQFGEQPTSNEMMDRKPAPTREETDEEMARRLASTFQAEDNRGNQMPAAAAAQGTSPMDVEPRMSDEEIARMLQAEWDAEVSGDGNGNSSVAAVSGSPSSTQWRNQAGDDGAADGVALVDLSEDPQEIGKGDQKMDFETFGDSFRLYHYNGLRGGTLTPFRVTRLSAEEAVGASIALNRGAANASVPHSSSSTGDLEDVVRTKWPSCMINWLGKDPPYID